MHRLVNSIIVLLFFVGSISAQVDITGLSGGEITTEYNDSPASEGIEKLIDNSPSTKYLTFHASVWVQYKSPVPYVISKYSLISANDAPERDPLNCILEGSNNGVTFYELDSRSNIDFPTRGLKKEFTVSNNSGSYLYYRLKMTNNSGNILQLAEMELIGVEGTLSTELFADFSIDSYFVTEKPVFFTDASLNMTTRQWTFEGGNPATSTDAHPEVTYENPGEYTVKLEVSNGTSTKEKTVQIKIKDINDWSDFVYPDVNLTCENTNNSGYIKYQQLVLQKGFSSIEDFVKNCCLVIAKELYCTVDEANEHNLRTINYKLNEGGSLSYKGGNPPTIEIGFDMNYLNSFSQSHSDDVSADEIYGVLCHEICHGYQREPRNAGSYADGTEYFGFIEGTADLARLLTGGFNPPRHPRIGGNWTDGYNTTAFFYQWLTHTKSSSFLKDMNRTALTIDPWSLNSVCISLFGESAQSLWDEYQTAIPTLGISDIYGSLSAFVEINSNKTGIIIENIRPDADIAIYNLKGILLFTQKSISKKMFVDISKYPKGIYIVKISQESVDVLKFVK